MAKQRNYKQEWKTQHAREMGESGTLDARMERQRARRKLDKEGVDRKGKDIAHKKALSLGGSNADGYFLDDPKKNRSFARKSNHKPKNKYDKP